MAADRANMAADFKSLGIKSWILAQLKEVSRLRRIVYLNIP